MSEAKELRFEFDASTSVEPGNLLVVDKDYCCRIVIPNLKKTMDNLCSVFEMVFISPYFKDKKKFISYSELATFDFEAEIAKPAPRSFDDVMASLSEEDREIVKKRIS